MSDLGFYDINSLVSVHPVDIDGQGYDENFVARISMASSLG